MSTSDEKIHAELQKQWENFRFSSQTKIPTTTGATLFAFARAAVRLLLSIYAEVTTTADGLHNVPYDGRSFMLGSERSMSVPFGGVLGSIE